VTGKILRGFSYIYQFILALILTVLGALTLAGGMHNLNLTMLPWKGAQLTYWVLGLGIAGIVITALAATGAFRYLFPLWCLFVVIMMVRGFFWNSSQFVFAGPGQFRTIILVVLGAIVAFLASLTVLRRPQPRY
jgi:hypothetical protein